MHSYIECIFIFLNKTKNIPQHNLSGDIMKNKAKFLLLLILAICFCFNPSSAFAQTKETIYLGGMPAGFSICTKGAEIVSICDVLTENGFVRPLKDTGIIEGDVIKKINNKEINGASDIKNALTCENVIIEYQRGDNLYICQARASKDVNGTYRLGVYIRDNINGIGTITYIKDNKFAALGHPVLNHDGKCVELASGKLYNCNISGCIKGVRGHAGELRGAFVKTNEVALIDKACECGVFGSLTKNFDKSNLIKIETGVANIGDAFVYSTINGNQPKKYSISIVKIEESGCKNYVIKINDKELISQTGGIVQGMSGSPIVQNGKLVGAITHVFLNDPTRGFGININNMLNN